jgi:hypothetical protein
MKMDGLYFAVLKLGGFYNCIGFLRAGQRLTRPPLIPGEG